MNERKLVLSIPAGGSVTLIVDETATPEAVATLQEATALMFRSLRAGAGRLPARDPGEIEYASWTARLHCDYH